MCLTKINLVYLITLIISGENYKLIGSSSCNFLFPLFYLSQVKILAFLYFYKRPHWKYLDKENCCYRELKIYLPKANNGKCIEIMLAVVADKTNKCWFYSLLQRYPACDSNSRLLLYTDRYHRMLCKSSYLECFAFNTYQYNYSNYCISTCFILLHALASF
jgi:hypothetical protein